MGSLSFVYSTVILGKLNNKPANEQAYCLQLHSHLLI